MFLQRYGEFLQISPIKLCIDMHMAQGTHQPVVIGIVV
jgi:hypothetical protein